MRRILAAIKAPVSRNAKTFLKTTRNEEWLRRLTANDRKRETFRFWQPGGGYDGNIWKTRTINEVIDYIHANPVHRGLTDRPTDWKWSSAAALAGITPAPLRVDQVEID